MCQRRGAPGGYSCSAARQPHALPELIIHTLALQPSYVTFSPYVPTVSIGESAVPLFGLDSGQTFFLA